MDEDENKLFDLYSKTKKEYDTEKQKLLESANSNHNVTTRAKELDKNFRDLAGNIDLQFSFLHSKKYSNDNPYLPNNVGELTPIKVFPEDVQRRYIDYANDFGVNIDFNAVGDGHSVGSKEVNLSPSTAYKDSQGRLFTISNGITSKRKINGIEHAVIQSVLVPHATILLHEIGHVLYDGISGSSEALSRVDKEERGVDLTWIYGYPNEIQNIQGSGLVNENSFRSALGVPLRYGYLGVGNFQGGKTLYEPLTFISKIYDLIKDMDSEYPHGFHRRQGGSSGLKMKEILNNLQEGNDSIRYDSLLYKNMRFSTLFNLFNGSNEQQKRSMTENMPHDFISGLEGYNRHKKSKKKPLDSGLIIALKRPIDASTQPKKNSFFSIFSKQK